MEPFIGQIILFGGDFAPRNWAFCDGQLMSIAENSALFSILGTQYGGDGQTTFALPDLRGRVPVGPGHGPGLSSYHVGQKGGMEDVTLMQTQIPSHTHTLFGETAAADQPDPLNNMLALSAAGPIYAAPNTAAERPMASQSIGHAGGSQPHYNLQPFLGLHYIIALYGIFPSRS